MASEQEILQRAVDCVGNRAATRDDGEERSMNKTVQMFNILYGKDLSEEQGWMFMTLLKAVRSAQGDYHEDDYVDGGGYFGLAGETASRTRGVPPSLDDDVIGSAMVQETKLEDAELEKQCIESAQMVMNHTMEKSE